MAEPSTPDDRTIIERLNAVMAEVDYVQKEKKSGMNYSIVSHDAVTAKVRPVLAKHGVVYYPLHGTMQMVQDGNRTQMQMAVRFICARSRGPILNEGVDFIDVAAAGYGIDQQDKGPGKAISYCVKYALLKALGLESGDDPDYDQDTTHKPGFSALHGALELAIEKIGSREQWEEVADKIADAVTMLTKREVDDLRAQLKEAGTKYPKQK